MGFSKGWGWLPDAVASVDTAATRLKQSKAFGWTLCGTLFTQLGTYLSIVLLTRTLGIEDYGRLATIQATLAGAFGVANLGTGITATRFVLRYLYTDPDRAGRILGLSAGLAWISGLVMTVGILSQADWIAGSIFQNSDLSKSLRWSSLCCLFLTINANLTGALLGFQAFSCLMRVQLLNSMVSILCTFLLVRTFAFQGAVIAVVVNPALGYLMLSWATRAECRSHRVSVRYWKAWKESNTLRKFALPAAASGLVASISIWVAQMILVRSGMGVLSMGAWTAAQGIRAMALFAPSILTRISGPILSEMHDQRNSKGFRQALWQTSFIACTSTLVVGAGLWAISPWLILVMGQDFKAARSILPLTLLSAAVEAYASSVSISLLADGKLMRQIYVMASWGGSLILTTYLTVPWFGPNGLALAYLCSWMLAAVVYTLIARGILKIWLTGEMRADASSSGPLSLASLKP